MLDLAKGLLEHALKTSAIRDCQCAHCMGFKEEAPQWLDAVRLRSPVETSTDPLESAGSQLYRLLVVRGYAQHEAHMIAFAPKLARISSPLETTPESHVRLARERLAKAAAEGGFTLGPIESWDYNSANCAAAGMERANMAEATLKAAEKTTPIITASGTVGTGAADVAGLIPEYPGRSIAKGFARSPQRVQTELFPPDEPWPASLGEQCPQYWGRHERRCQLTKGHDAPCYFCVPSFAIRTDVSLDAPEVKATACPKCDAVRKLGLKSCFEHKQQENGTGGK